MYICNIHCIRKLISPTKNFNRFSPLAITKIQQRFNILSYFRLVAKLFIHLWSADRAGEKGKATDAVA